MAPRKQMTVTEEQAPALPLLPEGGGAPEADTESPADEHRDCTTCAHMPASLAARWVNGELVVSCPKCAGDNPAPGMRCNHCGDDMPGYPQSCDGCGQHPLRMLGEGEEPYDGMPDNWTPKTRPGGGNTTWVREETITVTQPLTEAEKIEYGQEMADALGEITRLEGEFDQQKKYFKRLIEEQEKVAKDAARLFRDGKEEREVYCDLIKDWDTMEMVWTEAAPPHAEVMRRPMTEQERQLSLLDLPEKPATEPGDDPDGEMPGGDDDTAPSEDMLQ